MSYAPGGPSLNPLDTRALNLAVLKQVDPDADEVLGHVSHTTAYSLNTSYGQGGEVKREWVSGRGGAGGPTAEEELLWGSGAGCAWRGKLLTFIFPRRRLPAADSPRAFLPPLPVFPPSLQSACYRAPDRSPSAAPWGRSLSTRGGIRGGRGGGGGGTLIPSPRRPPLPNLSLCPLLPPRPCSQADPAPLPVHHPEPAQHG